MDGSFLLDTHAFLWAMFDSSKLSRRVRTLFGNEEVTLLLSAASVWEIALKSEKGKIEAGADQVDEAIEAFRIKELPIRSAHIRRASLFPAVEGHKDPFDRLIAAQAVSEHVPLVSKDAWLRRNYADLAVIW